MTRRLGYLWLVVYLGTIVLANWLVSRFGIVPIAPHLSAPAGVYAIGFGFLAENRVTEFLGRRWTLLAIAVGVAISFLITPHFAMASGLTFLCSETLDFLVFVRVRRWLSFVGAALIGDVASDVLDSIVFLWLAFGSLQFLEGQLVGKWVATGLGVLAIYLLGRRSRRVPAFA